MFARIAVLNLDGAASGKTSDSLYRATRGKSRRATRSSAKSTTVAPPLIAAHHEMNSQNELVGTATTLLA